jgi:protein ImuA
MPLTGQPDLALIRPGRVHEATGPARRAFAAALAGRLAGPVLWIIERRGREMPCPQGLAPFLDPARLILARPAGARALLEAAEEALRSGAVPLVVTELAEAPDLTQSRRLQLAAGAGGGRGLCLVPETGLRPNAAETRWHCAPLPGGPARQRWELVKNKRGRLGVWQVSRNDAPGPAPPADTILLPPARSAGLAASA